MNKLKPKNNYESYILSNIKRIVNELPISEIQIYGCDGLEILHIVNFDDEVVCSVLTAYYEGILLEENVNTSTFSLSNEYGLYRIRVWFEKGGENND